MPRGHDSLCTIIVDTTFLVADELEAEIWFQAVMFALDDVVALMMLSLVQE